MPINNQNSFVTVSFYDFMTRTIFIKEIIAILKEPKLCPTCQRDDRLETGIVKEERSSGKTILCSRCEALIVVTNYRLSCVELASIRDDHTIMLKEPHLIRMVRY